MELIERPNLDAVKYLNSISFKDFRDDCIRDAEDNGDKKPLDKDIKTWYSILRQYCKTTLKTKGNTKRIYSFSLDTPAGQGGRLFSGGSLQSIWCPYRGLLMRGLGTDIDMENCHPVILRYVCKKHNIHCPSLEYYINHRDECLSQFATRKIGKNAYLIATNSEKISRRSDTNDTFKRYDREMKDIQNKLLLLPDYKDIIERIPDYKMSQNFNGSVINRILCKYENEILQEAIHVINRRGLEIAILMFDGLMVYGNHYEDDSLLREIEREVEAKFAGLGMKWSYKDIDDYLVIPADFEVSDGEEYRHANDDTEAARFIIDDLKDDLRYSFNRIFFRDNHVWISDESSVKRAIFVFILSSNIKKLSSKGDWTSYAQNNKSAKSIAECVVDIIKNETVSTDDFYHKLHSTTKGRLCFQDGVLDLPSKQFYKWADIKFEYYTPTMIQMPFADYFAKPDRALLKKILDKVFTPLFGEHTTIALQFLARALAGHSEDKNWLNLIGNRDCGKGVIFKGLKGAFGDYVDSFELSHFLYQRDREDVTEVSRKMYWIIPLEFVRFAISQEVPKYNTILFNGKMMKKIQGGGDEFKARRNYDREDTTVILDTTFAIMGNDELKSADNDVFEHCLQIASSLQFKTKTEIDEIKANNTNPLMWEGLHVADPTLKDNIVTPEWKKAIIYLIFKYYTPSSVSISREVDTEEDNNLRSNLLQYFAVTRDKNDIIPVKDIYNEFSASSRKITAELKQLGVEKMKHTKQDEFRQTHCFYGLKRITENAVNDPSEDTSSETYSTGF